MIWEAVSGFEVDIDDEEIRRIIGTGSRTAAARGHNAERRIERSIRIAEKLIEPAAIYTVTEGRRLEGPPILRELDRIALSICTIGRKVEERVAKLSEEGAVLDALVIDTAGSTAVEKVADHVASLISELAGREGMKTSRRASPGYGDWDISAQKKIFDIAPSERIGVSLGEGMMMEPRKSVSFAIHIAEDPENLRSANDCRSCSREGCPYRRPGIIERKRRE